MRKCYEGECRTIPQCRILYCQVAPASPRLRVVMSASVQYKMILPGGFSNIEFVQQQNLVYVDSQCGLSNP